MMRRDGKGRSGGQAGKGKAGQSDDALILAALRDVKGAQDKQSRRHDRMARRRARSGRWQATLKPIVSVLLVIFLILLVDGLRREHQEFRGNLQAVSGMVEIVERAVRDDTSFSTDGAGETTRMAEVGDVLRDRELLRTGPNGEATVVFPDGSATNVLPQSEFEVRMIDYHRGGRRDRSFMVRGGNVVTRIGSFFGASSEANVCTPTAVAAVRGTAFLVSYDDARRASSVQVVEGRVDYRTPAMEAATPAGQRTLANGYAVTGRGNLDQGTEAVLNAHVDVLADYEQPPHLLKRWSLGLTSALDPVLQLMGITPGGWGYDAMDTARRTTTMEALRLMRQHLEAMDVPPEFLNPVTLEELHLQGENLEVQRDRILDAFNNRMIDRYQRTGNDGYEVRVRSRDKQHTPFLLTNAQLVELEPDS